ncbi:MAG: outer membrane protein assembly factor BamD [Alphaproteobacteria bacterium]|nr:outer membrane protein assembly factor BamD [Alphaproteobacteria bacterium]
MAHIKKLCIVLALVLLASCEGTTEKPYVEKSVDQLYSAASKAMEEKDFAEAARLFDEVERQHPYSEWASRAQIMSAFSHYQNYKYDDAINTLDRFIQIHPGHAQIAYAYYLKALCHYEQISDVRRDQGNTAKAMDELREVSRRFPGTPYARDAELKIGLAKDHLAGKEMEIGRYYLNQKQYIAALGRFRRVIEDFQTTSHVPEALHRIVETYLLIGIPKEAQTAAAVLGYNYPGNRWYQDSYEVLKGKGLSPQKDEASWIAKQFSSSTPKPAPEPAPPETVRPAAKREVIQPVYIRTETPTSKTEAPK